MPRRCGLCRSRGYRLGCPICELRQPSLFDPPPPPPSPEELAELDQLAAARAAQERERQRRLAELAGLGRPVLVGLIGCGKQKAARRSPARDLYQGRLFKLALTYSLRVHDETFILSARHGLVALDEELTPYDLNGHHPHQKGLRMPPITVRRRRAPSSLTSGLPRARPLPVAARDQGPGTGSILRSAADVVDHLRALATAEQEHLWCFGLNAHHRVITSNLVALGTVNEVKVVQRDVFRELVRHNCAAFVVIHNHPSGAPEPSPQDTALTVGLQQSGVMLGISLVDHVVIGGESYYSYAENGRLHVKDGR